MIVIASKYGQLGNRLFVFANFIAFAMEHGIKIINPSFEEYAEFFPATRDDLLCRYPAKRTPVTAKLLRRSIYRFMHYVANCRLTHALNYRNVKGRVWDAVYINDDQSCDLGGAYFRSLAKSKKVILTQGWLFRDPESLVKHADAIRGFFRPVKEIQDNVDALIREIRATCDVLVGVHIRQGDYRDFMGGKYFFDTGEYVKVMRDIERLFEGKSVGFLVCSNSSHEAKIFGDLNHTFGTGHVVEDMYSLASCDYIVGPPSTYTLWASFYGRVPLYSLADPGRSATLKSFVTGQERYT